MRLHVTASTPSDIWLSYQIGDKISVTSVTTNHSGFKTAAKP